MVMTDVCPFTLGVGISKRFGRQVADGYYMPVLHRNTTIPVSREEAVYTMHANQDVVRVDVYQGEARRVEDNLHLGRLLVKGVPPGPAGHDFAFVPGDCEQLGNRNQALTHPVPLRFRGAPM